MLCLTIPYRCIQLIAEQKQQSGAFMMLHPPQLCPSLCLPKRRYHGSGYFPCHLSDVHPINEQHPTTSSSLCTRVYSRQPVDRIPSFFNLFTSHGHLSGNIFHAADYFRRKLRICPGSEPPFRRKRTTFHCLQQLYLL
jgi:hypothetical protein